MSPEEIRTAVLKALGRIAPEADLSTLDANADIREALDVDSMDINRFVIALHQSFGVDIAEKDYPKYVTVASAVLELAKAIRRETPPQTRGTP